MSASAPVTHRRASVNGIELHTTECGEGRPIVLLHGFPELWYSWRHQLPALAEAGYRAIAPDLRGYGESSAPDELEAYDLDAVCGDFVALLDALGEAKAVFIGHDWGATVAWQLALAQPERVAAIVALSVPFVPRPPAPPISLLRQGLGDDFYIVWFQQPGVADEALARDVRRTMTTTKVWSPAWARGDDQPPRPAWLTEADVQFYVRTFERTGFTGGLNYYRNLDRNWERSAHLADRRVEPPAMFITGSRDPVSRFLPTEAMDGWVTDMRGVVSLDGAGHWVQQERPSEVNAALLEFLQQLQW